jgi:hypothetical protein
MTTRRINGRINLENSPVIQPNRPAREELLQPLGTIAKIVSGQEILTQGGRHALTL